MDITRNRDAELAAIGTALMDRPCAVQLAALPADAFTAADTRSAHDAIRSLIASGAVPDLVTVASCMYKDLANPEQTLVQAMQLGVGPAHYGQYEGLILECFKRRTLVDVGSRLLQGAASAGESPDSLAAEATALITGANGPGGSISMHEALMSLAESIDNAGKGRCTTGIADFDRLTGGIRGGKLIVLGARPGIGKTALSIAMATHVARHAGHVLFVSLEMDEAELAARIVAAEKGIDVQELESGRLSQESLDKLLPAYAELDSLPMHFSLQAYTPSQIRRDAVALQNRCGLAMIVVDYIQLMHSDRKHNSRYEEVSEISRELKLMAMDLGVPVLALTQFNRNSESSTGGKAERRKPQISEAKDSGSIEQDANMFIVHWTPPEPPADSEVFNDYSECLFNGWEWQFLSVDKNRQGRTGQISIAFDKPHMRFICFDRRKPTKAPKQEAMQWT